MSIPFILCTDELAILFYPGSNLTTFFDIKSSVYSEIFIFPSFVLYQMATFDHSFTSAKKSFSYWSTTTFHE